MRNWLEAEKGVRYISKSDSKHKFLDDRHQYFSEVLVLVIIFQNNLNLNQFYEFFNVISMWIEYLEISRMSVVQDFLFDQLLMFPHGRPKMN